MIEAALVGTDEVRARFEQAGPKVDLALYRAISRLTLKLEAKVHRDKLQGQVLNQRSGRLNRSIHSDVRQEGHAVTGEVGTNVEYAAVHEYGGTVTVKEHLRMMTQAFGREVKNPRKIVVRAHDATYPERSFLRSALKEMQPEIKEALDKALREVAL